MRREDENCMKRIMTAEANGRRSRGRQKKRWEAMIQQDMKLCRLKKEHAGDRKKWRRRICVADPSPGRDYFKPERDISTQNCNPNTMHQKSIGPKISCTKNPFPVYQHIKQASHHDTTHARYLSVSVCWKRNQRLEAFEHSHQQKNMNQFHNRIKW